MYCKVSMRISESGRYRGRNKYSELKLTQYSPHPPTRSVRTMGDAMRIGASSQAFPVLT